MNASNVVRRFRCDLEFVPEVAGMIVEGVVVKIFMPYKGYYHITGPHAAEIHDE